MEIISNGTPRDMVPFYALPANVQSKVSQNYANADLFDWVQYKGEWYCMEDFVRVGKDSPFPEWDGCLSDTYFSGVLVRLVDDGERVIFGRYFS
jgi:hypothetical protein